MYKKRQYVYTKPSIFWLSNVSIRIYFTIFSNTSTITNLP